MAIPFKSFSSLNTTSVPLVRVSYRWMLTRVFAKVVRMPRGHFSAIVITML